jgi:hypothetical protein
MEVALRRRLVGVAEVSISQSEQTAAVTFAREAGTFSAAEFRSAVAEADVEVVAFQASVCGVVNDRNELRLRDHAGQLLVRLRGGDALDKGTSICVSGQLDDRSEPYELQVATVRPLT